MPLHCPLTDALLIVALLSGALPGRAIQSPISRANGLPESSVVGR